MSIPHISSSDLARDDERVLRAAVPLHLKCLNVVSQVRPHLDAQQTADLAESILDQGQQVPGRVVALTARQARQYVKEINELWGVNHQLRSLRQLTIDGKLLYLIVVYGHRRLAAAKLAYERLKAGEKSRYFTGKYLCDIYFGLSVKEAISFQLIENDYVAPPKHAELRAHWLYWRFLRRKENVTVTRFAKQVGKTPEAVREMLRFTELPDTVQRMIDPDAPGLKTTYGMLLQVARLARAHKKHGQPLSEEAIVRQVDVLIVSGVTVTEFAKEVTERIHHLEGQQTGFDFFENGEVDHTDRTVRRVAAQNLIRSMLTAIGYIHRIEHMMRDGRSFGSLSPYEEQLDGIPSLYSPASPAKMAVRVMDALSITGQRLAIMLERDGKARRQLDRELGRNRSTTTTFAALLNAADTQETEGVLD